MKIGHITQAIPAFEALKHERFSSDTKIKIKRMLELLKPVIETDMEKKEELIKKYDGVVTEFGLVKFSAGKEQIAGKEYNEFLSEDTELEFEKIKVGENNLTLHQEELLKYFIEFVE